MKLFFLQFAGIFLFLNAIMGCGPGKISGQESALLHEIASGIGSERDHFRELEDFRPDGDAIDKGYFSSMHQKNPGTPLIMNPGVYWFKVSLSKKAVDPFDSPMPVFSVRIPAFQKYLKLRVRGSNDRLTYGLIEIVRKQAVLAGGTDERLELQNASEEARNPSARRGFRRF